MIKGRYDLPIEEPEFDADAEINFLMAEDISELNSLLSSLWEHAEGVLDKAYCNEAFSCSSLVRKNEKLLEILGKVKTELVSAISDYSYSTLEHEGLLPC